MKTTDYVPVDCAVHDEIEALCLRRANVCVHLKDGTPVEGTAMDWTSDNTKAEYLHLESDFGGKRIRLDRIIRILVNSENGIGNTITF